MAYHDSVMCRWYAPDGPVFCSTTNRKEREDVSNFKLAGFAGFALAGLLTIAARGDTIEFLNDRTLEGKVVRRTADSVILSTPSGAGSVEATIPTARIHALVVAGQRSVLHEKPTRASIEALIQKAGTTPPDWWNAVPLEYPPTLDLTWPVPKPKSPWDANRNVGQYVWSVINENPGKWRSGARLLHHLLTVNQTNAPALDRTMGALATVYMNLLQDWPRAAFWYRKALVTSPKDELRHVRLAECYWRLGSKALTLEELAKVDEYVSVDIVKLWAEMGDLERALAEAESLAAEDREEVGWLAAGDACRLNGDYKRALQFYQQVQASDTSEKWVARYKERAQANIAAMQAFNLLDLAHTPDGTYTGSSISYTGPLEVAVDVKQGKILAVRVTKHTDKQYYTALTETPRKIVERQSLKGIDAVTSATVTCDAIVNATAKALATASKPAAP